MILHYDRVPTPRGDFTIIFNERGIFEILFPGRTPSDKFSRHPLPWPLLDADFNRYLGGDAVDWGRYPLDCSGYSPFTAALLEEVRRIPFGRVCTYREVAERAGSPLAWRAAGQALKRNRHPVIVPCHRVIGSGGRAGGFSGPPGWKRLLLEVEGAAGGVAF